MASTDALDRGRAAFRTRSWAEAYTQLSAADEGSPLGARDLELLAVSAYLVGEDEPSIAAWTRAHHGYVRAQNAARAARCTFWLVLELLSTGEWARAGGWLATAQRLLNEGRHDCPERGLLFVLLARSRFRERDDAAAYVLSEQAAELADRFDDPELKVFGRLALGQARAKKGEADAAAALFDEVMVAVTTSDVSPIAVGVVYCAVIEACYAILDVARAREWTAALSQWCGTQPDLVPFRGHCLVHRAETMRLGGAWSRALDEAGQVCRRVSAFDDAGDVSYSSLRGYPIGAAFYELAEIQRMRGKFVEAEEAYRQASHHGRLPEPGLALLRLAQGRVQAAEAAIRRVLDQPQKRLARVSVLVACIEIMIPARDLAMARTAAEELSAMAGEIGTPFLRALSAHARGTLLLAEREPRAALDVLRAAWMEWQALDIPYEAARARVLMGLACRELGDHDAADLEFDAARCVFLRLDAAPDLAQVQRLLSSSSAGRGSLTPRELQVMKLLAAGRSNRAIARELTISERTVDRHVSNILTKLDLPSRSAATAYAWQHGLV